MNRSDMISSSISKAMGLPLSYHRVRRTWSVIDGYSRHIPLLNAEFHGAEIIY